MPATAAAAAAAAAAGARGTRSCVVARVGATCRLGACARACGDRNHSPAQQPQHMPLATAGQISSVLCSIWHG
eukprot:7352917-Prymnesium_polylepis.1